MCCPFAGITVVSAVFGVGPGAQDGNEIIAVYNEGAKAMQTDVPVAIAAFEKVVTLSDQVRETANDLKQNTVKALPGLYNTLAAAVYNEKKSAVEIRSAVKLPDAMSGKYVSAIL